MLTPQEKYQSRVIEARRQQILDAAGRVFARSGFHRATISEIAREAGVADGTIYNYFENKEALLQGLLLRLQEAEGRLSAVRAGGADAGGALASLLHRRMAFLDANREMLQALLPELLVQSALREVFMRQIVSPGLEMSQIFLETRVPGGGSGSRADEALVARSFEALALGSLLLQILGDQMLTERWPELPEMLGRLFATGWES